MSLSSQFLEAVNGALLVVFLGLEFFFARYILGAVREFGLRDGYRYRRGAVAMFILLGGDTLIRASAWAWRHFEMRIDNEWLAAVVTAGVVICILGGSCALREFAPASWGRWPWIAIPVAGVVFGIAMAL